MKKINLRDYYPYYTQDMIVEVPDEVALLLREYMLLEEAYRIRTYLALLIANPKRVFTYELITDLVWKEDCDFYSRKAIHNHISKLRKKLRFEPDLPNYIESVAGIGYKFEHL